MFNRAVGQKKASALLELCYVQSLSMKYLLTIAIVFLAVVSSYAQSASTTFVVVTQEYSWPDGMTCGMGEVESVHAFEPDAFIILSPQGGQYRLPRTVAKVTTAEDAALRLLAQRRELYSQLNKLEAAPNTAPAGSPSQSYGLSKSERSRMLYVLREERIVNSIRKSEDMTDQQILDLYNQAMQQRALRRMEGAIRNIR